MQSFLKGRKLWRYVTGDITMPTLAKFETDDTKDITTPTLATSKTDDKFDSAKFLWDFLAQRYTSSDLSHQYHLLRTLHQLRQEPGQSIADFHSKMQFLWD
ncbi:hypothetical protein Q3G72_006518 [Acer saccharum]|nr:hypothetical protein Q3G72_006518 [Acer saccharum]